MVSSRSRSAVLDPTIYRSEYANEDKADQVEPPVLGFEPVPCLTHPSG